MMYCAKLNEQNTVTKIIVVSDTQGITWCTDKLKGQWVIVEKDPETQNANAVIGSVYNPDTQTFTPPTGENTDG